MCQHPYGCQKITCRRQFFPFILCMMEIKLGDKLPYPLSHLTMMSCILILAKEQSPHRSVSPFREHCVINAMCFLTQLQVTALPLCLLLLCSCRWGVLHYYTGPLHLKLSSLQCVGFSTRTTVFCCFWLDLQGIMNFSGSQFFWICDLHMV